MPPRSVAVGGDEVLDRHAGPAVDRREAHLGLDVVELALPGQSHARLPLREAGALEHLARRGIVEHLDDAPADAGLAAHLDDASAVAPEVDRAADPPEVHLLGERMERGRGIHRDLDLG